MIMCVCVCVFMHVSVHTKMQYVHTLVECAPTLPLFPVSAPATTAPQPLPTTTAAAMTTGFPTTEPLPPTVADVTPGPNTTALSWLRSRRVGDSNECYRYLYGTFMGDITIIGR